MALSPGDPNSYSRPDIVKTTHVHLELEVDFGKKILVGRVVLSLEKVDSNAESLVLDARDLTITKVTEESSGQTLEFSYGSPSGFGEKVEIKLPKSGEKELKVSLEYRTSSEATALQWLSPAQTAGKTQPYMFSQCQAIHARSMLPCQDTPSVKTPYTATITAPAQLTALMSAVRDGEDQVTGDKKISKFVQKVPIQSYLIAIAVGALESRKIGPRSHVWSEKEYVDKAAFDFSETESFIETAEELCGPYVWGIYDILVLPPSFAYGGMENPCMTFATPTLLTGDKSNADVIAHEITHSWTGNLITNSTFEHFWLNEGFTVFIERKIRGRMKGEAERHFTSMLRWKELEEAVNEEFSPDHEFTKLVPSLIGVDPDDAFCRVPYEKGSTFLWYLEEKVGGSAVFEPFMKDYFKEFSFKSLNSDEFKDYFTKYFQHKPSLDIDWASWYYKPGMPDYKPDFDQSLACHCWQLADKWLEHDRTDVLDCNFDRQELERLSPTQVQELLSYLLQKPPVRSDTVQKMDDVYKLSDSLNCEILFLFLRLGLRSRWEPAVDKTLGFLKTMGRLKFVRPLYRDLAKWEEKKKTAVEFFTKNKHLLMSMVVDGVVKDLDI